MRKERDLLVASNQTQHNRLEDRKAGGNVSQRRESYCFQEEIGEASESERTSRS
jgi:hypothetical protein